jgi:sugar lactone lactonase YvrE
MKRRLLTILPCLLLASHALLQAGTIDTVIGTGKPDNNGNKGPADTINVGQPFGVELGPGGRLYVTEVQNHRVLRLDLESGQLTTVAGTGKAGYSGDGGPATEASLNEPYEIRFDREGNMFWVEMKNHLVRRVDAKSGKISTVAGTGIAGYSGDGGPATRAQLRVPHSIALDGQGGLYIADIGNHRIRKVDLESGQIHSIAGNDKRSLPSDGQQARGNPILGPRALCFHQGTLWIALREGHSVWKLPLATGTLHHVAGDGMKGFAGDGGSARTARFNGPKGIAIGPKGLVYVVDTENQVIRRIDPARDRIDTVAGSGPDRRGGEGDKGPATRAQLDRPHGICVGPDGTIYIGDTVNHRVRRVKP